MTARTARALLKFADAATHASHCAIMVLCDPADLQRAQGNLAAAKSMLEEALNCEPFTRSDEASERVPAPDPAAPWADDFGPDHGKGAA